MYGVSVVDRNGSFSKKSVASTGHSSLNDRETDRTKRKFVKTIAVALISCLDVILGPHAKTKNDAASQENHSGVSRIHDDANRKIFLGNSICVHFIILCCIRCTCHGQE